MTVAISADSGAACVELADHHGECFVYEVRPVGLVGGWQSWSVERRNDKKREHAYTVGRLDQLFRCSCPDFKYKRTRWLEGCKHCRACAEAIEFFKKFMGG